MRGVGTATPKTRHTAVHRVPHSAFPPFVETEACPSLTEALWHRGEFTELPGEQGHIHSMPQGRIRVQGGQSQTRHTAVHRVSRAKEKTMRLVVATILLRRISIWRKRAQIDNGGFSCQAFADRSVGTGWNGVKPRFPP